MRLLSSDAGPLRRGAWLAPPALLLPMGTLVVALGPLEPMQQHGPRLVWAFFLLWGLLSIAMLHGARGRGLALAAAAVAAPLGLLPWVGLGALLAVRLAIPVAVIGCALAPWRRSHRLGFTLAAGALGVGLFSLLALAPAVGCGGLPALDGASAAAQLASIVRSDQEDRRSACFVFNPQRDASRRALVRKTLIQATALSPPALSDAGLVLLHGTDTEDLEQAHILLLAAQAMGHEAAEPLARVALDRLRLARGQPQVHGTQWFHSL